MVKVPNDDKIGAIHHYVPQGYLKRFSLEEKADQVYAYELGKSPFNVNVHNVAGQRDFYTFTDPETGEKDAQLEDAFAEIDTVGIELLRKLDEAPLGVLKFDDEDKGNLLSYVAFQHTRNVQEMKNHATMHDLMIGKVFEYSAHDKDSWHKIAKDNPNRKYDFDEVEKARKAVISGDAVLKSDPSDQYFLATALKMSRVLYEVLFIQKTVVLVEAMSGTSGFVTSDNPVTHYLLEEQKKSLQFPFNGLGYINAVFQFPISPNRCLLFINDDMKLGTFHYDQEAVDYINYYTYFYADRWIFASTANEKFVTEFEKANNKKSLWKMD